LPPLYQRALDKLAAEQARIDAAVAAGAFVSRDRDSALKTMIYLAASRYDPDAEAGHTLGGAKGVQTSSSLLRKISLTAVRWRFVLFLVVAARCSARGGGALCIINAGI
jgi:hypothetical protein